MITAMERTMAMVRTSVKLNRKLLDSSLFNAVAAAMVKTWLPGVVETRFRTSGRASIRASHSASVICNSMIAGIGTPPFNLILSSFREICKYIGVEVFSMGRPKTGTREAPLTEAELLALPKIRVDHAARFLQNGTTAQEIRVQAQFGVCPYCKAERMTGRFRYRINPGLLIKYKAGELGM